MTTAQAHAKDAEAAGRYVVAYLQPKRKSDRGASVDVIVQLTRWACHWARLSQDANA